MKADIYVCMYGWIWAELYECVIRVVVFQTIKSIVHTQDTFSSMHQ